MIERYPVTSRLYGIGTPTLLAAGVFGWPFAVLIALVAALVCLVAWT